MSERAEPLRQASKRSIYHAGCAENLLESSEASDISVDRKIKYATQAAAHATLALFYQAEMRMLEFGPASGDA